MQKHQDSILCKTGGIKRWKLYFYGYVCLLDCACKKKQKGGSKELMVADGAAEVK